MAFQIWRSFATMIPCARTMMEISRSRSGEGRSFSPEDYDRKSALEQRISSITLRWVPTSDTAIAMRRGAVLVGASVMQAEWEAEG